MGLGQNRNDEFIAQFYATLWIEVDDEDMHNSRLHWTLEGHCFSVTYHAFAGKLGFDDSGREKVKIDVFEPLFLSHLPCLCWDV